MAKTTFEVIVPPFELPEGLAAERKCKRCYGRGTLGFDTVKKAWIPCRCVTGMVTHFDGYKLPDCRCGGNLWYATGDYSLEEKETNDPTG